MNIQCLKAEKEMMVGDKLETQKYTEGRPNGPERQNLQIKIYFPAGRLNLVFYKHVICQYFIKNNIEIKVDFE